MSQNYTINPYFDPDPRWYFNTLYALCAISSVLYVLAIYMVLKQSPKAVSKTFQRLLVCHITTATVFELNVTVLSPMLLYFPFAASEAKGLLTWLNVGADHQMAFIFASTFAALLAVDPLFYYRMRCLLPDDHFFNKKIVNYSINASMYILFYVMPIPLVYLIVHYQDQNEVKQYYEKLYNMTFPNLYSPQVIAFILKGNPWAIVGTIAFGVLLSGCTTTIVWGCSIISYRYLKKSASLSTAAKKHHISLFKSLIAIIIVIGVDTLVLCPTYVYLLVTSSYRIDILYWLVILAATVMPVTAIVYCTTYKPYREFVLKKLRDFTGQHTSPHLSIVLRYS